MTSTRVAQTSVAIGCALAFAELGCHGNRSEDPPIHLQQNMDQQDRGEAQEPNPFFADGRFMRPPPFGTVAVGHLKTDRHLHEGIGLDGAFADALPAGIALDEVLLDRGEQRFNIYCQPCHGRSGRGDGPATRRGGGMTPEPVNLHMQKLQPAKLGYIYNVIAFGKGNMNSYAAQVPVEDRWAIAAWVRVLQLSHRASASDLPSSAKGGAS
jgi:mono/diheme cytochrome c family protein